MEPLFRRRRSVFTLRPAAWHVSGRFQRRHGGCDISRLLTYLRGSSGDPYRPYQVMLACDMLIVLGVLVAKIARPHSGIEYDHLLVTYKFGLLKRAFIGEALSYVLPTVGVVHMYALGVGVIVLTLGAYLALFHRCFGLRRETLPLLVFTAGSPFFFKNFMHTVGYFDIYGCLVAILAALLPVGAVYVAMLAIAAIVLLLIHHLHFLLYLPAIFVIAVLRLRAAGRLTPAMLAAGGAVVCTVSALFFYVTFYANAPIEPEALIAAMRERASDPVDTRRVFIWYSSLWNEIAGTWSLMPGLSLRIPVYVLLVALHWPLIRFGKRLIDDLAEAADRRLVYAGLFTVSASYVAIFVTVFDQARWVSNWAVCMALIMHAASLLPSSRTGERPHLEPNGTGALAAAWLTTAIPRVGITRPF